MLYVNETENMDILMDIAFQGSEVLIFSQICQNNGLASIDRDRSFVH